MKPQNVTIWVLKYTFISEWVCDCLFVYIYIWVLVQMVGYFLSSSSSLLLYIVWSILMILIFQFHLLYVLFLISIFTSSNNKRLHLIKFFQYCFFITHTYKHMANNSSKITSYPFKWNHTNSNRNESFVLFFIFFSTNCIYKLNVCMCICGYLRSYTFELFYKLREVSFFLVKNEK